MSNSYDNIRASIFSSGEDSRVEVNQRALIDKILARYATAGAVYRELIQNSNDAEANTAQIRFTTTEGPAARLVSEVVYRNDGLPFRPQDWQRLRKIAEGNPDVAKIGAFGVGAYTMFSICEEPLVISGNEALAFVWKGDALWTKTGPSPRAVDQWTTFVLPSRDPYPVPNLVEFGQFLCASLTFTQCLHTINVFVDEKERLIVSKRQLQPPRVITPPKSSSWWRNDGAVTQSPKRIFTLGRTDGSITETVVEVTAMLDNETSSMTARYISALANVHVPHDIAQQMYRVTKKKAPTEVKLQIFIDADAKQVGRNGTHASAITEKFSPALGNGNIFIGFKTSQTTGLAAHLAAPLVPTVEREAIDLQNPSLKVFNSELLFAAGILMRLALEHSMGLIGRRWDDTKQERMALDKKLKSNSLTANATPNGRSSVDDTHEVHQQNLSHASESKKDWLGFASFMSSNMKRFAGVISSVYTRASDDEILLNPEDPRPLSVEEKEAIVLMCSFCPEQSTPDALVGSLIAEGFIGCMPGISPPVLTNSGVMRSSESRLPYQGIERFVTKGVIRKVVQQGAGKYLKYVAGCIALSLTDLEQVLPEKQLSEEDLAIFLKWWIRFCRLNPYATERGPALKAKVCFVCQRTREGKDQDEKGISVLRLETVRYYREERTYPDGLPMPSTVLPQVVQKSVTERELKEKSLTSWFSPLPFAVWASHISTHSCLTDGKHIDSEVRLLALKTLSEEYGRHFGINKATFEKWLQANLASKRCIPFHFHVPESYATEYPGDLYLSSANISLFEGLGSFKKVSTSLGTAGVSDDFLVALGVRKAIAIDFLFTQLDNLKWRGDPKPLISYLCKASLTASDRRKLQITKYLPADGGNGSAYAPSELHLPNPELTLFPFVKTLYWPSTDELSEKSPEGRFLKQLGCQVDPQLRAVLNQITKEGIDDDTRAKVLSFAGERLKPGGSYQREYSAKSTSTSTSSFSSDYRSMKFLPAIRKNPLMKGAPEKEFQSPMRCYTDSEVLLMGFSVLDPNLTNRYGKALGERFLCSERPPADQLIGQLLNIASFAKSKLERCDEEDGDLPEVVTASFSKIFDYLSTRTKELDETLRQRLKEAPFIPCLRDAKLTWFRPTEIYFQNANSDTGELTSALFYMTEYNPFLAVVGVQSEPSSKDIFNLVVSSPKVVLEKIGSVEKYVELLRRISSNFSTLKVLLTPKVRNSAFLLAFYTDQKYTEIPSEGKENATKGRTFVLAKARDISIVDDAGLARMFNVLCAPDESDLEMLYSKIGSEYISKRVRERFEYHGHARRETHMTKELMIRIQERKSLLVSPTFNTLPLKPNAGGLLSESNLDVYEVDGVTVSYALDNALRKRGVTCFAFSLGKGKISVYITPNFDWLDVGAAISKLILEKSDVQGSFFVGSLLEAPLERLRARGLPVDRILKDSNLRMQSVQNSGFPEVGSASKGNESHLNSNLRMQSVQNPGFPEVGSASKGNESHLNSNLRMQSVQTPGFPEAGSASNENESHINSRMRGETVREASSGPGDSDGFLDILTQMFPDCDERHIQSLLGNAPTLDKLRQVADTLSDGLYPKRNKRKILQLQSENTKPQRPSQSLPSSSSRAPGSNAFTRAFRNSGTGRLLSSFGKLNRQEPSRSDQPVPASQDVARQDHLKQLLHNSVRSSRKIPPGGVRAPDGVISSIPRDMTLSADTCEAVPGHDLKPFLGMNGTGKTRDGIRVFSSRHDVSSETYLSANADAVEAFAGLLQSISNVYSLKLHSIAIFYQPSGNTIAFNASGALHFNLRFFTSLHWSGGELAPTSYAYWFTVMAHELAHNFVSPHNKDHGHFTESYIMTYLPRLLRLLS